MTAATPGHDVHRSRSSSIGPPGLPGIVIAASAVLVGVYLFVGRHIMDIPHHEWFYPVAIAYSYIAAGLIAWGRRPDNRTGRLMVLAGLLYFCPALQSGSRIPIVYTIGSALASAGIPALIYATLAFPRGLLSTRWDRALFGFAVFEALFSDALFAPWFDPTNKFYGCADCQRGLNLLLVKDNPSFVERMYHDNQWFIVVLGVLFAGTLVYRFWTASGPKRRVVGPLYLAMSLWALVSAIRSLARILKIAPHLTSLPWSDTTFLLLVFAAGSFLFGLLRTRMRRSRVGELAIDLGVVADRETVRDHVARVLGDRTVEVGYWVPGADGYRTPDGSALPLPAPDSGRAVQYVSRGGSPLAVIVHDDAVLDDPVFIDRVVATLALGLENERLQAEVRSQLAEVQASRARIVEAADSERRRVERNLHDGAQQRLLTLGLALRRAERQLDADPQVARGVIDEAAQELNAAIEELRELARGIHPAILSEEGLGAALDALAERSAVRVVLADVPDGRFPVPIETTAYFVVAEALTNVAKYSGAPEAQVHVEREDGSLHVEVSDNGVGGADPRDGSGLRGLLDRVLAVGGRLEIDSPPGQGTRLSAELPCD